ncbi:MAG: HAD-IIB family hydrolase [Thiohalomonadales bacterium]
MTNNILICTDLDRTLIPNGDKPVSDGALEIFTTLCTSNDIQLCYVTGRNFNLTNNAISEYKLPIADFLICDVGASAYYFRNNKYSIDSNWTNEIESDWNGMDINLIHELLDDIKDLILQEQDNQSIYKLSYYTKNKSDDVVSEIKKRLNIINVNINIISSYDEINCIYLIDILPKSVSKLHAVNYLMEKNGDTYDNTIYSGDSGNDIEVFTSGIPSIIVKNAHRDILNQIDEYQNSGLALNIYIAKGDFYHLNGNYVSGILEGLSYFHSSLKSRIRNIITNQQLI